ncbi:cystathionine gamma-synthase [Candidatus Aminicenantes bacterium AC-708-M15]|jgi:O-succinylhomoserine (thiol)-lyase|nr:cystathionine gamma-synthase [SCandidatus Aminicenantes bacterium Aminicenantia_JdfR_composite]MCP2604037.1 cystathionine gamma-synthase [Candidatus Aminicenantes bacterium AC-708-M15]MCP2618332.1 cystathionine gamma-synthase [Candidatus Aminicenantes bacterium AC-335-A11]
MRFETKVIHIGQEPDPSTGAIVVPIYQTSTYVQEAPGKHKGYEYSRTQNPTRAALEKNIAALENGKYGLAFSSGMAAINTIMNLLKSGDHIVAEQDLYGGTHRLFTKLYTNYEIEFDFVDMTDLEKIRRVIKKNTKLLWLESPTNPLLKIIDIQAISKIAKENDCLLVVDNTFATPYFQQPINLGADIVVHSTSKYLGGHCDLIGGAIVTSNKEIYDQLAFYQNAVGGVPGPFDCWLVLRGIKTLTLRMERHNQNALAIARYLESHPKVRKVYYPGLPSHPQYELAKKQMRGFGGMVSFELKGDIEQVKKFVSSTQIISLAESLGGVESLIEHPATMTHSSIPKEERIKSGLSDELVRLSVGIEHQEDLIADLEKAFEVI